MWWYFETTCDIKFAFNSRELAIHFLGQTDDEGYLTKELEEDADYYFTSKEDIQAFFKNS